MQTLKQAYLKYEELKNKLPHIDSFKRNEARQAELKAAHDELLKITGTKSRFDYRADTIQAIYKKHEQEDKAKKDNNDLIKLTINNIKYLKFIELLPQVIAIINKYEGKRCGEKTKQKIYDDIKNKLKDYYIYFDYNYIAINDIKCNYDLNNKINVTYNPELIQPNGVKGDYYKIIDNNNKICKISIDNFYNCYKFINNFDEFIKNKNNGIEKIGKEYKTLKNAVDNYNNLYTKVDGFDYIQLDCKNLYY